MHQSHTKLMVMSVIPERPYSADSATRALHAYQKEIDYSGTEMHVEAQKRRAKFEAKRKNMESKEGRRTHSIDGIEERSEIHEQDGKASASLLSAVGRFKGESDVMTQSKINLMKNALEGKVEEGQEDALKSQKSLTYIECKYLLSVLMNRSVQANWVKENSFDTFYKKARMTLRIQMKKLLLGKQFKLIDKQYKNTEGEKETSEILIKILSRCLRMFDAQGSMYKILNYIESRIQKVKELRKE